MTTMTAETWNLDSSRSGIRFSVRHLLVAKISGRFVRWRGTVRVSEEGELDFASVELVVDTASVDTGLVRRDLYLRSLHFLNAAAYPSLMFMARRIEKGPADRTRIAGDLTIRSSTREVLLDVEDHVRSRDREGNDLASFTMKTSVDRRDFGLTWIGALDSRAALLSDRVDIELEVDAARMTASEEARLASLSEAGRPGPRPPSPPAPGARGSARAMH
jgi:polyisoprenoid-binding protein YceI